MPYSEAYVDDLIARADILVIARKRLRLKRRGKDYYCQCPFHQEGTPSFTITTVKQFYHCFGCGCHGNVLDFLMQMHHINFPQAVSMLAKEVHYYPKMWRAQNKRKK